MPLSENLASASTNNFVMYNYQVVNCSAATVTLRQQQVCNGSQYYVCGSDDWCQTPETAEQKAARLASEARQVEERKAASKRAEELLLCILTEEQRARYLKDGWFETACDDRVYCIGKGRSMNVERGGVKYCAHPGEWTPDEDVMAAQLLMLRTDEAAFLRTANKSPANVADCAVVAPPYPTNIFVGGLQGV